MSVPPHAWSLPVRLEDIPEAGLEFELTADQAIRSEIARVAGVQAVPRLQARFDVTRHGRDGLHVTGTVSALVRQTCVVTLDPVENEVHEPVDLTFVPQRGDGNARVREEEIGPHDSPETLVNGAVDLGAIATEFLILGIDPYPRKAGAVFSITESGDSGDHPFAALEALKKRS